MPVIPYDDQVLRTALPGHRVLDRLRAVTDYGTVEWNEYWFTGEHRPYTGEVGDRDFRIRRRHIFANPFSPMLAGHLTEDDGVCAVSLTIRPTPIAGSFVGLWIAGWIAMGILAVVKTISVRHTIGHSYVPITIGLAFYLIWTALFHILGRAEVRQFARYLEETDD